VFARCAALGFRLRREPTLQRDPIPNEVASEAVFGGLDRLKDDILVPGAWDPGRGTTFEGFFTICCLGGVANAYRKQLRRLRHETSLERLLEDGDARVISITTDIDADPAAVLSVRDLIDEALGSLNDDDRYAIALEARGWTRPEIAPALHIERNTLDVRMSRARKKLRDRRDDDVD
jgi:DNA-directed RNA polymerase specialized sigma24 family protein